MNSTDVERAVSKLQRLSDERAGKVMSLINDLAELEALEDADDLKDAHEALAEVRAAEQQGSESSVQFANPSEHEDPSVPRGTVLYDIIRRDLGLDQ